MVALPTPASDQYSRPLSGLYGYCAVRGTENRLKNTETREKFHSKPLYFPREMEVKLKEAMSGSLKMVSADTSSQSSALKLDILYNKRTGKHFASFRIYPLPVSPFTGMVSSRWMKYCILSE